MQLPAKPANPAKPAPLKSDTQLPTEPANPAPLKSELTNKPIWRILYDRMFKKHRLKKQIQKEYTLLMESGMFDADYYLSKNPDVAKSGMDPLLHFIEFGWKENRNPDKQFDVASYLKTYPDVRASGMNPLAHYLKYGKAEGRRLLLLK